MSGSMAPDPPVTAARPGHYLRFVLIIAIGFLWTTAGPQGLPGRPTRPSENKNEEVKKRFCRRGHPADTLLSDGRTYTCECGHIAWEPEKPEKDKKKGKKKDTE
jgi:hypothetical protein